MIHVINVIGLCKSQKAVKRFGIVMAVGQLIVIVMKQEYDFLMAAIKVFQRQSQKTIKTL